MDARPDEQAPAPDDDAPGRDGGANDTTDAEEQEASSEMMHLLHEGIPLALLADLASPGGPHSPDILQDEGLPDVAWWGEGERPPAEDLPMDDVDDEADEDDDEADG
ncbi:MAG: hypothetical protein KQH57_15245 [Actinomycetales bacterium]|nr:hypothetical protein [Actinomycetales bacterium]